MVLESTTLKARLLAGFIVVALVPLLVATTLAVTWYRSTLGDEAERALMANSDTARALLDEQIADQNARVASVARVFGDSDMRTAERLPVEIERQSAALDLSYLFFVDTKGVVSGSTSGVGGHMLAWDQLAGVIDKGETAGFITVVPVTELVPLGQAKQLELDVQPGPDGTAAKAEVAGALSIAAVAPVQSGSGARVGTLVGVKTVKLDTGLVDSMAEKVGGVVTIFQNGVRVASSMTEPNGERAVGTPIADEVRAPVLEAGQEFQGSERLKDATHLSAYEPLRDIDGVVVGALFVGVDNTPYANAVRNFTIGMTLVTILGVGLATAIAYVAARGIAAPIHGIIGAAEQVTTGDLTVKVPETGFAEARAMGRTFNAMIGSLRDLIGNVDASTGSLDGVASEITVAASNEAESASAQASSVAEATATLEELDRSFGAVAEGARRVREIAEDSLEVADSGRDLVQNNTVQVAKLADSAGDVLTSVDAMTAAASDIGQFTSVIRQVAEQTKILALNAAIEAARAGESGKGFGVVATEIRALADSVSLSVGQINKHVSNIQEASKDLATNAERQVIHGTETVQETMHTRDRFDEIYARMDNTAAAAREIAAAASQQQAATKQIVEVMQQVSQGVSGTATSAAQVAEAASHVKREAGNLSSGLRGFRLR